MKFFGQGKRGLKEEEEGASALHKSLLLLPPQSSPRGSLTSPSVSVKDPTLTKAKILPLLLRPLTTQVFGGTPRAGKAGGCPGAGLLPVAPMAGRTDGWTDGLAGIHLSTEGNPNTPAALAPWKKAFGRI